MPDHITHHDDCGCQSAALKAQLASSDNLYRAAMTRWNEAQDRIATLEAELVSARLDADLAWKESGALTKERNEEAYRWMAHANALRDALVFYAPSHAKTPGTKAHNALAQTPAASLAARDAEVLERAVAEITNRCVRQIGESALIPGYNRCMDDVERAIKGIRALAAQAATHSVPDGTSEVKP